MQNGIDVWAASAAPIAGDRGGCGLASGRSLSDTRRRSGPGRAGPGSHSLAAPGSQLLVPPDLRQTRSVGFSSEELEYVRNQPSARLATVSPDGQPDVTPVALEVDGETLWICGAGESVLRTRKIRNIAAGHHQVALVVDDLPSMQPFVARGIRI